MINGNLEQFLDTGWSSEAELYYNGYVYWCEAQYNSDTKENLFFVDKWEAENENNLYYHSVLAPDGTLPFERVYEKKGTDLELIKQQFLSAPLFEGKTFWQVENDLAWLDAGTPVKKPANCNTPKTPFRC